MFLLTEADAGTIDVNLEGGVLIQGFIPSLQRAYEGEKAEVRIIPN